MWGGRDDGGGLGVGGRGGGRGAGGEGRDHGRGGEWVREQRRGEGRGGRACPPPPSPPPRRTVEGGGLPLPPALRLARFPLFLFPGNGTFLLCAPLSSLCPVAVPPAQKLKGAVQDTHAPLRVSSTEIGGSRRNCEITKTRELERPGGGGVREVSGGCCTLTYSESDRDTLHRFSPPL